MFGNNISSTALRINIAPFNYQYRQGILLGYYIYFQEADDYFECNPFNNCTLNSSICHGEDVSTCFVMNLGLHTNYSVCVAAFTSAGSGPISDCIFIETDTFGMYDYFCIKVYVVLANGQQKS